MMNGNLLLKRIEDQESRNKSEMAKTLPIKHSCNQLNFNLN